MTERDDWVDRLQEGSPDREQAIEQLRHLLVRGLSKSLAQRYGGAEFSEDVAQEALLKILASLDQFEGRSRFTTWAMTIATRVAISQARRRYFRDVSLDAMESGDSLRLDATADPASNEASQSADLADMLRTMQELIDTKLTDKQRFAVRAVLEGLPVEEVAARMQSNRNATYKLVHDARAKLREGFEELGINSDDVQAIMA